MTPADLSSALAALFGDHKGALADAGRALDVNTDSLRHMIAGRRGVPDGLAAEVTRRLAMRQIAPPPATLTADMDRDEPCSQALEPHLDDLLRRSVDAGWHPAEVLTATLGWAAHSVADMTDIDEARSTVAALDEMLVMRGHTSP